MWRRRTVRPRHRLRPKLTPRTRRSWPGKRETAPKRRRCPPAADIVAACHPHSKQPERVRVRFVSFGYDHGPRPTADLIIDARNLVDPYLDLDLDPMLKELPARDARVQPADMRTPGAIALVSATVTAAYFLNTSNTSGRSPSRSDGVEVVTAHPYLPLRPPPDGLLNLVDVEAYRRDLDEPLLPNGDGATAV